jgi:trigger factor
MALQISKEPRENCQLALTIEVDQERVDQELRKAARKAARDFRIPGFRQGKAPYSVIVQYVGLPTLYNEFVDDLGQEIYKETLEQESIEPYATATLENVEFEPLRYTLIVPLEPEIDLGDYRSLRIEEEEPEVSEEEINERLREYQEQNAGWQEVDRPSTYGDLMTIDVRSVLIEGDAAAGEETAEETVVLEETDWEVTPDQENPMDRHW